MKVEGVTAVFVECYKEEYIDAMLGDIPVGI